MLGRVYEYFLGKFAAAEGKLGGEFFTPRSVVRLLVEMIEPYEGRVYDPCCGSGGMFVQSEKFAEAHGGNQRDISIFGQESNPTTWRLAHMNLAIRGIEANLGEQPADSFVRDLHPDLKADYILANPPFNISDWSGELLRDDVRWKYGVPPVGNANYAWIQHFIHHLAPPNGRGGGIAGFVMANGSLSINSSRRGRNPQGHHRGRSGGLHRRHARRSLFLTTGIPVCLWFVSRDKTGRTSKHGGRDRRGETLFIDARQMGTMETRVLRVLSGVDAEGDPPAGQRHRPHRAHLPRLARRGRRRRIRRRGRLLQGRQAGRDRKTRPRAHPRPLRRRRRRGGRRRTLRGQDAAAHRRLAGAVRRIRCAGSAD